MKKKLRKLLRNIIMVPLFLFACIGTLGIAVMLFLEDWLEGFEDRYWSTWRKNGKQEKKDSLVQ